MAPLFAGDYIKWDHGVTKWRSVPDFTSTTRIPLGAMQLPALNAELTLDPKGRVMLPRQLRDELKREGINRLVAFANGGPQGGLALYTIPDFNQMTATHQGTDPMDPKARLFALAVRSTAQTVNVDSAGRMLVPKELRKLLGLERGLYLFTAGGWFEVWDLERWEAQAYPKAAELWDDLFGFGSLQPAAPAAGEG